MLEWIGHIFHIGTLILFFFLWLLAMCIRVWWNFNKFLLIGMSISLFIILWLGSQ